ncbi:MAG: hypothetical protein ACK5N8_01545 [Alphaproteobacteria bacterium]
MKKFIAALLIIMLSATVAQARPAQNNPHRGGGYHQKAPVVVKEKRSKGDVWAASLISGVAGYVIGSNVSSSQNYVYAAPSYSTTTTIVRNNEPNCVTTYDRWAGTTTTTCRSTPQYDNVVIIR